MDAAPPFFVGLVGDGDEIAAIEDVEQAFGVTFDRQDGQAWRTAGDVFVSLLELLPPDAAGDVAIWERFTTALALETGVDPRRITTDSPLLLPDKGFGGHLKEALFITAVLWLAMLLLAVAF
jgi:hypothetical protein